MCGRRCDSACAIEGVTAWVVGVTVCVVESVNLVMCVVEGVTLVACAIEGVTGRVCGRRYAGAHLLSCFHCATDTSGILASC